MSAARSAVREGGEPSGADSIGMCQSKRVLCRIVNLPETKSKGPPSDKYVFTTWCVRTCTFRALRPIARPTSSRMAVVGKRDCELH